MLPLRLHFHERGSLRRRRAAVLSQYAQVFHQQALPEGRLLSVALSLGEALLFERLIETLGESGLRLPFSSKAGSDFFLGKLSPAAARMAEDNNHARILSRRFGGHVAPAGQRLLTGLSEEPVWDPDPLFRRILDRTEANDLPSTLVEVEAIAPEQRDVLFDEVLYLKFCLRVPLRANDLRYVARCYVRNSSIVEKLTQEFDRFLALLDPLLPDWDSLLRLGYPWDRLKPWPRFRTDAYRRLKVFGHPSWPRGRIFVWHPDLYTSRARFIHDAFRPALVAAENAFRRGQGRPDIGRKWRSQNALFDLVLARFDDAMSQWSPPWLAPQSLDIYVPSLKLAIEYQGRQHYEPIDFFGGESGFRSTRQRDEKKRKRLMDRGVRLVEWRFDRPINEEELEREIAGLLEQRKLKRGKRI